MNTLENPKRGLKYTVDDGVIDASGWVPQHRERIFIIGFRKDLKVTNEELKTVFPKPPKQRRKSLDKILFPEINNDTYTLTPGTWNALIKHKSKHKKKGNGFGYGLIENINSNTITRTLSARYYKDGSEILIRQNNSDVPRRLSPLECMRLMGFPKMYEKYFNGKCEQPVSDCQAYRQFGNSVVVPVIKSFANNIVRLLNNKLK
jgi:DNA (cytosine-5)-methyltransferase 1